MTKLQKLEKEIEKLQEQLRPLEQEWREEKRKTLVSCIHCKRKTQVGKLTLITPWFYVEPYGCTGGDYWKPMEEKRFVCLKCNKTNRLMKNRLTYTEEQQKRVDKILELEPWFGSYEKVYK